MIRKAKKQGFHIIIKMNYLESPLSSVLRVAERFRQGGHHVPTEDVIRRFPRSLANFWNIYRELADNWILAELEDDSQKLF